MVWFTGTSTGDRYNVGQSYESAGRVYTAQSDGSFSVNGSNRSVVGSSQDPTTVWGGWSTPAVGSGAAAYDGTASPSYGGGAAAGQVYSGPAAFSPVQTTGPGNPAAQNDAPGGSPVRTTGPGGRSWLFLDPNPANVQRGDKQLTMFEDEVSGTQLDQWQLAPTTPLMIGGNQMRMDRGWSDASQWEERYAEPGEWLGGLLLMGADAWHNAGNGLAAWNKHVQDTYKPPVGDGAWPGIRDWAITQDQRLSGYLHKAVGGISGGGGW